MALDVTMGLPRKSENSRERWDGRNKRQERTKPGLSAALCFRLLTFSPVKECRGLVPKRQTCGHRKLIRVRRFLGGGDVWQNSKELGVSPSRGRETYLD